MSIVEAKCCQWLFYWERLTWSREYLYCKRPTVTLERPVTEVQSILRLVSSCGVSFKIIIFPIGLMFDSFSFKYISPFWEKDVWVSLVSRESYPFR